MRVLVLHSRYRSGVVSGENRVVEDEVLLLREGGHEVAVFTPEPDPPGVVARVAMGVGSVWSSSAVRSVRRFIARHRPDIIHVHNLFPMLSPAVIRAAADEAPVVMTLHNYRLHCLPGTLFRDGHPCEDCVGRVPWRGAVHRCFRGSAPASAALATSLTLHRAIASFDRVRLFLAVSGFVRDQHVQAGLDPSRIRVRGNFSWPTPPRQGPGEHFLYLGRLSREKGVHVLLEAWRELGAPLIVAGNGPLEGGFRNSTNPYITYPGVLEPAEAAAALAHARALFDPLIVLRGIPAGGHRGGERRRPGHREQGRCAPGDRSGSCLGEDRQACRSRLARRSGGSPSRRRGIGTIGPRRDREWDLRFTPERALESLEGCYREVA